MKIRSTIMILACSMLAFACSKDKNDAAPQRNAVQGQEEAGAMDLTSSGEKAYDNKVTMADVSIVDQTAADQAAIDKIIADSADLTRDIATVRSITHVVETQSNTIDLYAEEAIVAILEMKDDVWSVKQSANSFSPKMIAAEMAGDPAVLQSLSFTFESCVMEEQPTPELGKGEEEVEKGKGEVVEPKEVCSQVLAVVRLERIVEEQQQEEQQQEEPQQPTPEPGKNDGSEEVVTPEPLP